MDDEQLLEAERRWRESGLDKDEAVYLLARVRAGSLAESKLMITARIGYMPAVLVVTGQPVPSEGLFSRLWEALEHNPEGLARVVIAAAHFIQITLRTRRDQPIHANAAPEQDRIVALHAGHNLMQDAGEAVIMGRYDQGFYFAVRAFYSYLSTRDGIEVTPSSGCPTRDRLRALFGVISALHPDIVPEIHQRIQIRIARWMLQIDDIDEAADWCETKYSNERFSRMVEQWGDPTP